MVSEPWPGKCLSTGTTPRDSKPRADATACSATTLGREPAEREPIVVALDQVFCQLDALEARPRHADPGAAWQDRA